MIVLVVLSALAVWDTRVALTIEDATELVVSERSTGLGAQIDGVFGARLVVAPVIAERYRFLAASFDVRAGTLGARASDGTTAVNVRSTDVKSALLVHLRWPVPIAKGRLRLVPAALVGLDMTLAAQTITAPGLTERRVAFIPGIGYGLRVALEGERFSVAIHAVAVSTDTRMPAFFLGLAAGFVLRQ